MYVLPDNVSKTSKFAGETDLNFKYYLKIDIFSICFIIIRHFLSCFGDTYYSDMNQGTDCYDEILFGLTSELSNAYRDNVVNSAFSVSWFVVYKVTVKGISATWMCLAIRVSPLFISVTVMKKYTSFEIEHRRILQLLSVLGLTVILLVDGLGVEDQQHGPSPFDHMHSSCCV